jgi:hypothetical protein
MTVREIDDTAPPPATPSDAPLETWEDVAAVGPSWRPAPGERDLRPVPGRLELHASVLVFRATEAVDRATGAPLAGVIGDVQEAGPLSPGSLITPTERAGLWMPGWMRRFRCPGFAVRTGTGSWIFDSPHGQQRAATVRARYGGA